MRLVAGLAVFVCLLTVGTTVAGADSGQSVSLNSPDNETAQAWFVQFSGAASAQGGNKGTIKAQQQAFYANASAMGLNVTQRQAYGTLWNGVSVNVPAAQAADLASVPGVTAVYPVEPVSLPPSSSGTISPDDLGSNPMIGVDPNTGGVGALDGSGVKVAVIDSGIDYTNPDLGGCFGPGCKVAGGFDLVGNSYDDTPTDPGYQPIPHPSPDPAPCDPNIGGNGGHGTHVAGIIGAKAAGPTGVTGVAPGVTLLAFKVFGCNGSTADDNIVAALEMAYNAGAQVVNMSLGEDYASWPESPAAQASDLLVGKDVVVVAAEGNAGGVNSALFSGGSPSVGNGVIAVGSIDNAKAFFNELDVDGTLYPYVNAAAAPTAPMSGSAQMATVPDVIGCAPLAPHSLDGEIALIKRGTCSFFAKASNAQAAGAIGVVLYNNTGGFISPTVAGATPITIPVVLIQQADGNAIAARIAGGHGLLTWTSAGAYVPQATGGLVSSFSSWGPTAELGLKPDVSAPGGLIRSTWPMSQYGGHNVISGTSMASPQVAGAAAILLQDGKAPSQVRDWLSNYSQPAMWNGKPRLGLFESPLRQGAGLIKVDRSVSGSVLVQPAKLSLGEGNGGIKTLTLTNSGAADVTYTLQSSDAISPSTAGVGSAWPNTFGLDLPSNIVAFSSPTVTVPAGGQATVNVSITPAPAAPTGELYDGFIMLMSSGGGSELTVPYAGLDGDYQSLLVMTPTVNGFPWLAKQVGNNLVQQGPGTSYTLQGTDVPVLAFHLNIPARKVNVQVENADGSFVQPVFNYAAKLEYLRRNSSPTAFFTFSWDGTRGQDNGNNKRKVVPNGRYMLKLSVLKPLGDESNPADWETFTTPVFTLARP
jgi:minor extracellular serine protease Vpr